MISSAVAFQMKGLGSVFQCSAQRVIAVVRSATEVNTPRRSGEFLEPAFHEIEPGTGGGGEMQVPAAAVLVRQPLPHLGCLVRGQIVQDDVHRQSALDRGVDLFEEGKHVGAGVALPQLGVHQPGSDVHRGEQINRAVPLVVVGHRARPTRFHRQRRLGAIQRLTLGFLVES